MGVRKRAALAVLLLAMAPGAPLAAQARTTLGEALQLERRGARADAAELYRRVLSGDPANATAILGLERVLRSLRTLDSLVPYLDSALAADPRNRFVREVQLRVFGSLGQAEQLVVAASGWIAVAPNSPDPYRQWAFVVAQNGNIDEALEILRTGRARLGTGRLASEMAQLHVAGGNWRDAAVEWRTSVEGDAGNAPTAVAALSQAPGWAHDDVLREVVGDMREPQLRRVAAELLVGWGRAAEGWTMLDAALPGDARMAQAVLRQFVERTRRAPSRESARARGFALERLAELTSGEDAKRARLDAAQSFADAGELKAARRMLERADIGSGGRADDAAVAMTTVIRVAAESGNLEEAERRFLEWEDRFRADDASGLRETIARGWMVASEFDRAERLLARDSTVNTMAMLGWIAVYRGNLKGAVERFRAAGPYAQSRDEATRRTSVLALIQRVEADSAPALGAALLELAQGDTLRAIAGLERVASGLPRRGGRADVLALAADLAVGRGDFTRSEGLARASLAADSAGAAAPGAELTLGLAYAALGRQEDAVRTFEHLILTFPESALVPQARRALDRARGLIPPSRSDAAA